MNTIPFINPATGVQFGEVESATCDDVTQAMREMRQAFQVWRRRSVQNRAEIVRKFQEVVIDAIDEISSVINQDTGKSRQDGLIEVVMSVDKLQQYTKHASSWLKRRRVPPGLYMFRSYYSEPHPYGVVLVIGPWNYPFDLTVPVMCSALLAGNTVIVKPSEVTAATGVMIENLVKRVPELCPFVRVLHGGPDVGAALVQSQPDLVFLTGSTATGQKIARATAETMTPFICELGGKDPMIVLEDADIAAAAKWGAWGAFYNTGQTCMGIERVYVVESVYDEFMQALLAETRQLKMGYTHDLENDFQMGPLTFERQVKIVRDHLEDALAQGARIVYGGKLDGLFMEPTIVTDVNHDMKLMREETFGPVLPVMKVKDETEAIFLANDCDYGLSACVWSNNMRRAKRVAHRLDVGSVNVNDAISHYPVSLLPFGGVKKSGNARTHCKEEVLQFTQLRSYAIGRPPMALDLATQMRAPNHYQLGSAVLHLAFGATIQQRLRPIRQALSNPELQPVVVQTAKTAGALAALGAVVLGLLRAKHRH